MSGMCIFLFGKFSVCSGENPVTGVDSQKVQELFSYLLLNRGRFHSRETLAELLWCEGNSGQSKKYLRQVIWRLQSALDSLGEPANRKLIAVDPEWLFLELDGSLWLDVAEFEKAHNSVIGVRGSDLGLEQIQSLKKAVGLYKGDLLEGWFHDWCLYERERFRTMFLAMLDKLMSHAEAHGDYEAGLELGERILRWDRATERTHWRMMRLYYQAGDRTAALRQYARCAEVLEYELGVKPSKRTTALYERILADHLEISPLPTAGASEPIEAWTGALKDVLVQLKALERTLTRVQDSIQKEIQSLELAVADQS